MRERNSCALFAFAGLRAALLSCISRSLGRSPVNSLCARMFAWGAGSSPTSQQLVQAALDEERAAARVAMKQVVAAAVAKTEERLRAERRDELLRLLVQSGELLLLLVHAVRELRKWVEAALVALVALG